MIQIIEKNSYSVKIGPEHTQENEFHFTKSKLYWPKNCLKITDSVRWFHIQN